MIVIDAQAKVIEIRVHLYNVELHKCDILINCKHAIGRMPGMARASRVLPASKVTDKQHVVANRQ